jgi:hypothetical protein
LLLAVAVAVVVVVQAVVVGQVDLERVLLLL